MWGKFSREGRDPQGHHETLYNIVTDEKKKIFKEILFRAGAGFYNKL